MRIVVYDNSITNEQIERIKHTLPVRFLLALRQDCAEDGIVRIDRITPPRVIGGIDMVIAVDVQWRHIEQSQVRPSGTRA
jgi:hypothetical protein